MTMSSTNPYIPIPFIILNLCVIVSTDHWDDQVDPEYREYVRCDFNHKPLPP